MRTTSTRRLGTFGTALVAGLVAWLLVNAAGPAHATGPAHHSGSTTATAHGSATAHSRATTPDGAVTPDGVASLGSATVDLGGRIGSLSPLAPCDVDGQATDSSTGTSIDGALSYGAGTSTCTRDTAANTTTSTATGSRFQLSALTNYGGPRIRIASYQVTCTANTGGTNASWSFSGLTGIANLPAQIPNDYTVPITGSGGAVVADAIFNEVVLASPNDGSITLNLLHIVLFPNGGPTSGGPSSGDVVVGATACSPTF